MANRLRDEVVSISGTKGVETAKALFFTLDKDEYPELKTHGQWFPFSQIEEIHPDSLVVSRWILEQKGIYSQIFMQD